MLIERARSSSLVLAVLGQRKSAHEQDSTVADVRFSAVLVHVFNPDGTRTKHQLPVQEAAHSLLSDMRSFLGFGDICGYPAVTMS